MYIATERETERERGGERGERERHIKLDQINVNKFNE